jgi:hypothetical protein
MQGTSVIPQVFKYILDHHAFASRAIHCSALLYKRDGKIWDENTDRDISTKWPYRPNVYEFVTQQPSCHRPLSRDPGITTAATSQIKTQPGNRSKRTDQSAE